MLCSSLATQGHIQISPVLLVADPAVIVESTYGVSKHLPRDQREQRFIEKVRGILVRGGRVLLPVVALGRAQVHQDFFFGALLMSF